MVQNPQHLYCYISIVQNLLLTPGFFSISSRQSLLRNMSVLCIKYKVNIIRQPPPFFFLIISLESTFHGNLAGMGFIAVILISLFHLVNFQTQALFLQSNFWSTPQTHILYDTVLQKTTPMFPYMGMGEWTKHKLAASTTVSYTHTMVAASWWIHLALSSSKTFRGQESSHCILCIHISHKWLQQNCLFQLKTRAATLNKTTTTHWACSTIITS